MSSLPLRAVPPELLTASPRALRARLEVGHPVAPADLAGWCYRGVSLGLWGWVERLTWKTFAKAFVAEPDGAVRGWNVRLHQDGLAAPPRPREARGVPVTFGHFAVRPEGVGVVLDYGVPANPAWDPARRVRDPVVALEPGDPTRLLGWSLVAVGPWRVPTPSWFLLERAGPVPFIPAAARPRGSPTGR